MKKLLASLLTLVIITVCVSPISTFAASGSVSLNGPGVIRAGDNIAVTLTLNGSGGILGCKGQVTYDASKLTLTSANAAIGGTWEVDFSNSTGTVKFLAYDNKQTSPINGSKALVTMNFKVGSVAAGTAINVNASGVSVSDGKADVSAGGAGYSKVISPPLSGDCSLKSLTVSNATLSPAFNSGVKSYTTSVPFEVTKLDIKATANDSGAKVSINSPNLAEDGKTTCSVTVVAANGAKAVYTIVASRPKDPNYVPSGTNTLSSLSVPGSTISPAFDPSVTNYVVWLPNEVTEIKPAATVTDSKSSVAVGDGSNLKVGDNKVDIVCTAENGTKKTYTITAKRLPKDAVVTTKADIGKITQTANQKASDSIAKVKADAEKKQQQANTLTIILIAAIVVALGGGFAGGYFLMKKGRRPFRP